MNTEYKHALEALRQKVAARSWWQRLFCPADWDEINRIMRLAVESKAKEFYKEI